MGVAVARRRQENSPSGLWRTLGKRVGCKPSGVRIPHSPQHHRERETPSGLALSSFVPRRSCRVDTIAAGVSCGRIRPNASCAAAAAAHHASYSGPFGLPPDRASYSSAKCGTSGNAGSRTGRPVSSIPPSVNSGWAPVDASAAKRSGTPAPRRNTASTAPSANEFCTTAASAAPNVGSTRAPSRWMPSTAARSRLAGPAAAMRILPSRTRFAGRPTTIPVVTPAITGTQCPTSNCTLVSPTSHASTAWPGASNTVNPSGAPRASNWLAPVTPSAAPTSIRWIDVSGGSDCSSAGSKASAQRLSVPSFGPATSSLAPSGNGTTATGGAVAASAGAANELPAGARAGRVVSIASRCRRPGFGWSIILVPQETFLTPNPPGGKAAAGRSATRRRRPGPRRAHRGACGHSGR